MKRVGTCPICNKGELLEFEDKFQCNFVENNKQLCNFFIYKSYSKKIITPEMLFDLLHNYETKIYSDFVDDKGEKFEAALKIVHGYINYKFRNQIVDNVKCVNCDGEILRTKQGWGCENYFNRKCGMFIYRSYNGIAMTEDNVRLLVTGNYTPFLNFTSKQGINFQAKLFVNDSTFQVQFDYSLGDCPKCSGTVLKMEKFFGCTNYLSDIKCDFIIWPSIFDYNLSFIDVEILLRVDQTDVKSFRWKDKEFQGRLSLDENFKCKVS